MDRSGDWSRGRRLQVCLEEQAVRVQDRCLEPPDVRLLGGRRGVYRSMAGAFYEAVGSRGVPFCFGFPNARALEVSHRIVGSRTLFPVWERRVPCAAFPAAPRDCGAGDSVSEAFDPLWAAASRFLAEAAVRDRARANWRFHARPNRYYRMVWRERAGRLPRPGAP